MYVRTMPATETWKMMKDLPAAAAGAMGAGMSFTICAAMSFSTTVVPRVPFSG